ncbi:hypothetical protein GCM10025867_46200 (plasmid) [Frondihabitans sucicola]|uniref:Uncharacterized protein n=1 Tax=Frondihabitans sucicola TaxID=1268041 RepID=A0ABN6Y4Z3_9MICO|nr:hypothetical protein [Frondihabitans sucicola]BDZ52379.1 hypothetical protein GCM10025867_46200 [Frondihabitans sucicola]
MAAEEDAVEDRDAITEHVLDGKTVYAWHGHMRGTREEAEAYREKMRLMSIESDRLQALADEMGLSDED